MAQHDMNIANQGFPAFRADLNDALGALVSNSSGTTAPATTFAHQFWMDTAADPSILKVRNADNDAWITLGTFNQTADTFTPAGVTSDKIEEGNSKVEVVDTGTGYIVFEVDGAEVARFNPDQLVTKAGTASTPAVSPTGDLNTGIFFPAADNIGFATGGTIRGRWTTDGLCFGSDTAAANALDDYEEGTFTPTIGGNATYALQVARYVKIGKIVHCTFDFEVLVIGTGSDAVLSGFPFTSANTGSPQTGSCSYFANINTSVIFVGCYIQNHSTQPVFVAGGASGTTIAHNAFSIFKNNARIIGQITYEVA